VTLLVAAVLLGLAAAGFVVAPILSRRLALVGDPVPGGVLDADARKRVALAALKEIEYDRIGGKLDEEDYAALHAQLEREAVAALDAAEAAHDGGADGAAFRITHSCGFVNPPGSRYCSGCGRRLGSSRAAPAQSSFGRV
jgi:hypothetical protein